MSLLEILVLVKGNDKPFFGSVKKLLLKPHNYSLTLMLLQIQD